MAKKTEYRYFTLRESSDEQRHIGTVAVLIHIESEPHYHVANKDEANKSFNEAVARALWEHFDEECTVAETLDFQNYTGTDPHDISFTFTDTGDTEPRTEQFEIEQTWLYE